MESCVELTFYSKWNCVNGGTQWHQQLTSWPFLTRTRISVAMLRDTTVLWPVWTPWCVAGVSSPYSESIGMMCMHTTLFFFVIDIATERHQTFLCWHAVAIYDLPTDKQQKLDWLKTYTKDRFDYLQSFDDDITAKRSCIHFPLDISILWGVFLLSQLLHFLHLDDSISGCNFSFS